MATVPSPRTWSVSDLETAALFNANIRDIENFLLGGAAGRKPSVNVYSNALTYSQPNSTETTLVSATIGTLNVGEDTDSGWNATTGVYTISTPGLWIFNISAAWAASTTGSRAHHFASTSLNYWNSIAASSDPSTSGRFLSTVIERFVAGNAIQPTVWQGSGGNLNLNMVRFMGSWIGA